MRTKAETAQIVADIYFQIDQGTRRVFRVIGGDEANEEKPVRLLEVNDITPEAGIMPLGIPAAPDLDVHYSTIIIEISPGEFERLQRGELVLPHGWKLGEELFQTNETAGALS